MLYERRGGGQTHTQKKHVYTIGGGIDRMRQHRKTCEYTRPIGDTVKLPENCTKNGTT